MKYVIAAVALMVSMQSNADSWLCIVDQMTGFNLENGEWKSSDFERGDKYLIKPADELRK